MSTRKKAKAKNPEREEWNRVTAANKAGIHRVLADIERGEVSSHDLGMLKNFCLFSFALMKRYGHAAWEEAKDDAEVAEIVEVMQNHPRVPVLCTDCGYCCFQDETHENLCRHCEGICLPVEQIEGENP